MDGGVGARRVRRTKSSRPGGPKAGPNGCHLEVGPQRGPRLLVYYIVSPQFILQFLKWSNIRYYTLSKATDFRVLKTLAESTLLCGIVFITNPVAVIMERTPRDPGWLIEWSNKFSFIFNFSHLSLILSPVHYPKAELEKSISPRMQNKQGLASNNSKLCNMKILFWNTNFTRFSCF